MPRRCPCGKQSYFGLSGGMSLWCKNCPNKPSEAINIKARKCKCKRSQPSFGLPGEKAEFCKECKPSDAINVNAKKCICGKSQPHFGLPGEKAEWCLDCKPVDAINIKARKCKCRKSQPTFGLPGEKAEWCLDCKPGDAINVISKKCVCGQHSYFGFFGEKPEFCKDCKPNDAIDVFHKKCKCGKHPSFGIQGQPPEWCSKCKPNYAINVAAKICPGYGGVPCPVRTYVGNGKAYCLSCDPDESRRLPRKKDEHAFFCFLEKHDVQVTQREYRIDYKCVETSKSHAFIDGVIITPEIVVCLEVDEDAHKNYTCDKARTNFASTELLLAFPEHHISWIRVNPTIGNFDRSDKALKIRDERYFEAVLSIRDLIQNPRTEIIYIGY
ncbi:hypothetical protein PBCVMA1E_084R [Paramecium bursaria Chlorella virus MA1E]|nr:hypothetical protein PBCVMA1E_084R [Paramecium bursaria Chlorella virus MA1E]